MTTPLNMRVLVDADVEAIMTMLLNQRKAEEGEPELTEETLMDWSAMLSRGLNCPSRLHVDIGSRLHGAYVLSI